MVRTERPADEWFAEAVRCYVEGHQGCAWCGGAHRVFQVQRDSRVEYSCSGCDFHVSHDVKTGAYFSVPGVEAVGKRPETMFEI